MGGTFYVLENAGVFKYLIALTIHRFGGKKYRLLCLVTPLCMTLGSTMGLLAETVPPVPILVLLALTLGRDTLTGLSMSILAVGFGFARARSILSPWQSRSGWRKSNCPPLCGCG